MKNKPTDLAEVYYDCIEEPCDPVSTISPQELYKIFDLSSESSGEELQGVSMMFKEPEGFAQKEIKRKKNRFLFCNIL